MIAMTIEGMCGSGMLRLRGVDGVIPAATGGGNCRCSCLNMMLMMCVKCELVAYV